MTVTPAMLAPAVSARLCRCGVAWRSAEALCWCCGATAPPVVGMPASTDGAGPREESVGEALVL